MPPGGQRWGAAEARQIRREDVEALLEQREHRLPAPPGVADAVQQHERLAGAAAVKVEPYVPRIA
jgi:hypothetical protein